MFLNRRFATFLHRGLCRTLCVLMLVGVFAPAVLAGGKKFFKEGLKYEAAKEWDRAAEEFSLALREEPGNAEYELHFLRSVQRASLMFMDRARLLVDQKDYEGAYLAYKQAFSFDPTNEQALARMKEMLAKQGLTALPNGDPDVYQKTADIAKKTADIAPPSRSKGLKRYDIPNQKIEDTIRLIARNDLRFNVLIDQAAKGQVGQTTKFEMFDVTPAQALEVLLDANNLTFFPTGIPRTIIVGQKNNLQLAQKYDTSMVQTFYIRNAKLQEVQSLITQMLGAGKQVALNTQLNTITLRDSPENLKIVQSLIGSIDKPQAEVVMDVNIYEVSHDDLLRIGNQFQTDPTQNNPVSLSSLGGLGTSGLRSSAVAGVFGPLGASLALPSSTFSFLQSKGTTKLVAQTQLHSFEGEEASVNVGQRVPIQTASFPGFTNTNTNTGTGTGTGTQQPINSLTGGINQVQYNDVGLNISIKPRIIDDLVQMTLSIESSGVVASTADTLTPTFTQRKMKGVARVRDSQTTIAASVMRQDDSNSRRGIPILSFLPGIGSLFTTPSRSKQATHLVITVTPHILRGGAVTPEEEAKTFGPLDFLIGPNGAQSYGRRLTLQELVDQADQAEQDEAKRVQQEEAARVNTPTNGTFTPTKGGQGNPVSPARRPDGIVQPTGGQPAGVGQPANGSVSTVPTSFTAKPEGNPIPTGTVIPTAPDNDAGGTGETGGSDPNAVKNVTPIPMAVVVSPTAKPQVGQTITVAVIVSSYATKITAASFYMAYNPAALKVTAIRDGGLLNPGNFNSRDDGGQVFAGSTLNPNAGSVAAAGQLALIDFQVIGVGPANLRMDVIDIRGEDQQVVPVSIQSMPTVTAVANPQKQ